MRDGSSLLPVPPRQSAARSALHARLAAVVAVAGVAAHLAMAAVMPAGAVAMIPVLAMAALCLPCAASLWRAPGAAAARMMVGMSLAMLVTHAALLLWGAFPAAHAAGHGAMAGLPAAGVPMTSWTLGVLVIEYAAALLAATWLARLRHPAPATAAPSRVESIAETA